MECERKLSTTELNTLFCALADERRRNILSHLRQIDDSVVDFLELANEIAKMEDVDQHPDDTVLEDVAVTLKHVHLPKLDDSGFVDYDVRSGTIRYRDETDVDEFLELARDMDTG